MKISSKLTIVVRIFAQSRLFTTLLLSTSFVGCMTNLYEQHYHDKERSYVNALSAVDVREDIILKIAVSEDDVLSLMEDGFLPIGSSSFLAPYSPMVCAIDTAEDHGAQAVLFDIKFKETKEYQSIIYLPSYSTSYTYGNVNATAYSYGMGQSVNVNGTYSGTTTSVSSTPVAVQESVDIYSHNALFLKKVDPKSFYGIVPFIPKRMPTEKKDDKVEVTVLAVLHGSKAESDGIRRGMKITSINGKKITNRTSVLPFSKSITAIHDVEVAK